MQLYGSIGGYSVVGKIDQLEIKDGKVVDIGGQDKGKRQHTIGFAAAGAQDTGAGLQEAA